MTQLYGLPTTRYAGRFIIEMDPTVDWSGATDVIHASDGSAWLDYTRLPVAGGTENRLISYEINDGADLPVRTLRATLHAVTAAGSISSGAVNSPFNLLSGSFSPAIFGGRRVLVQEPLGDPASLDPADWSARFWGHLDDPSASGSGDLQLFARDASARLMVPYTGDPVWIGTEGQLIPLDEAVQRVLDARFGAATWALKSPGGDLEWAIPAFEMGPVDDVLTYVREAAQQRGAVVRWWPDEMTGRFQLSIFVLQVDKTGAPDFTYAANQTEEISAHGSDIASYKNDFTFRYVDGATGDLVTIHRPATAAEIASFGLKPLAITEASTSHINSAAEATVMLDSIEGALRVPAVTGSRIVPRNPEIEVNSLLRFTADGRITQEAVDLYVVNWTERVSVKGARVEESTRVDLRGAPVGQIGAWLRSIAGAVLPAVELSEYAIGNVVWTEGDVNGDLDWDVGVKIDESWLGYALVRTPVTVDDWDSVAASVLPVAAGEPPVTLPVPVETEDGADNLLVQIEARYNDPATGDLKVGDVHRVTIYPKTFVPGVDPDTGVVINEPLQPPSLYAFSFPGSALDTTDIHGRITDASGGAITLNVWTAKSTYDNPDPDAAPDGTLRIGSTPANFGPDTTFGAAGKLLDEVMSHPAEPKTVYLEAVADDGRTTGKVAVPLSVRLSGLINELGELEAESAVGWANFIAEEQPPLFFADAAARVAALPDVDDGRYAWQADDLTEWQKQGGAWVLSPFPEYLKAFLIVGAVRAAALDVDVFEATSAHIKQAMVNEAWIEVLTALKANVFELSEIVDDMGIVVSGKLQNAAATTILNLDATGSQSVLKVNTALEILADGTITINGSPPATSGGGAGMDGHVNLQGSTAPTERAPGEPLEIGDRWLDTANGRLPYIWNGTGWQPEYTQISGGRIVTGTAVASIFKTNATFGDALNSNPGTSDAGSWEALIGTATSSILPTTTGKVGNWVLESPSGAQSWMFDRARIPIDPSKTYRATAWARRPGVTTDGTFYLAINLLDADGVRIPGDGTFWHYAASAETLDTAWAWEQFGGSFGAGTADPFPVNARSMQIGVLLNFAGTTGQMHAQGVRLQEVIPGVLIRDGAITAPKINVGALSEISDDLGIAVSGVLRNPDSTAAIRLSASDAMPGTAVNWLDLAATGSAAVLKVGGLQVLANGDTIVEDDVSKSVVLSHYDFIGDFVDHLRSAISLQLLNGPVTAGVFGARMPVPPGATVTAIKITGSLETAGNVCELTLTKIASGGSGAITTLGTASINSTSDQTIQTFITPQVVDSSAVYSLQVQLEWNAGSSPRLMSAEVLYTSHNYRQTL